VSSSNVRRIVTTSTNGLSHVAHDDQVEPITVSALPGYRWHRLWSFDTPTTDPPSADIQSGLPHFPPPGGLRFTLYTVPPESAGRPQTLPPAAERELEAALPGRAAHMESDQDGMHRTPSLDFVLVVSGEIWLELDNDEVHLREGDCIVQNGSRHAWRNKSDKPCTMAVVLVGTGATAG